MGKWVALCLPVHVSVCACTYTWVCAFLTVRVGLTLSGGKMIKAEEGNVRSVSGSKCGEIAHSAGPAVSLMTSLLCGFHENQTPSHSCFHTKPSCFGHPDAPPPPHTHLYDYKANHSAVFAWLLHEWKYAPCQILSLSFFARRHNYKCVTFRSCLFSEAQFKRASLSRVYVLCCFINLPTLSHSGSKLGPTQLTKSTP